jgi:nicotinamidase-related amidase
MPIPLAELVAPGHTALVLQECQNGVIGAESALPILAQANPALIPNLGRLARAARGAGVPVIHGLAHHRPDGFGSNRNARLFKGVQKSPVKLYEGTTAVQPIPELGPEPSDFLFWRTHGLSPFQGTELDWILRNEGITTIVGVGVSVNVAITNLTFDAVNSSYNVVIPRDAVAGTPADYVDLHFENVLSLLATVTTTDDLVAAWKGDG